MVYFHTPIDYFLVDSIVACGIVVLGVLLVVGLWLVW